MTTIADILAEKPNAFNFVEPDVKVWDALNLLEAANLGYLVVMHNQEFKGVFSEHDYCKFVAMRGWDPYVTTVEETMAQGLPAISSDDSLQYCLRMFNAHHQHFLPVFSHHHFKAVISQADVIRFLDEEDTSLLGFFSKIEAVG